MKLCHQIGFDDEITNKTFLPQTQIEKFSRWEIIELGILFRMSRPYRWILLKHAISKTEKSKKH